MPRKVSYGGSFDEMPLSVQRAASVPRDFYVDALCRTETDEVKFYFRAEPTVTYRVGSQKVKGAELNEWALLICHACPVQWECALAAIAADERACVWGDTVDNLWRVRNSTWVIENAQAAGVPVQVAIRRHLSGIV